jgi:predicted alpha/beta-hydrolase family hydrolase
MASHAVIAEGLTLRGLMFCSFPLHPPGKAGTERARHLSGLGLPMLFLSGTRDTFADKVLIESVVSGLPMATLHWLDTANHGYKVLKRSRQTEEDVFDEMARLAGDFSAGAIRPGTKSFRGG